MIGSMEEEDTRPSSDDISETDGDESSDQDVELMVTTRERRATAGNRYNSLVAQEQSIEDEEDEVALLFAEGEEEDDEFNSDAGAEDADMSSSDDEDKGPDAGAEDLDGEKEIQQQVKAEKARKRKADLVLTSIAGLRKKPKIDPTTLHRPSAPKPTKKKERVSWIPEHGLEKGRTSLRAQTIAHRAETHAKLKVNEAQRLKMKAIRQQREKQREADAPKELTQADRLAEAERIERKNAKSLNRWETMEKKRAEEQAAKLAALKDRKLHGAVVTWYSSSAKYIGLKSDDNVIETATTELKKRGRKPKAFHEQMAAAKLANENSSNNISTQQPTLNLSNNDYKPEIPATISGEHSRPGSPPATSTASKAAEESFLTGIHEYASMVAGDPGSNTKSEVQTKESNSVAPAAGQDPESQNPPSEGQQTSLPLRSTTVISEANLGVPETVNRPQTIPDVSRSITEATESITQVQPKVEDTLPTITATQSGPEIPSIIAVTDLSNQQPQPQPEQQPSQATPEIETEIPPATTPPISITSTRNLLILSKFNSDSNLPPSTLTTFNFLLSSSNRNKTTSKPTKPPPPEICPITGLPAKYRDPITGIGYANVTAYKKLKELRRHGVVWSGMLGCYVGREGVVARGVVDGFSGGK